jgi:hypothetical protein
MSSGGWSSGRIVDWGHGRLAADANRDEARDEEPILAHMDRASDRIR